MVFFLFADSNRSGERQAKKLEQNVRFESIVQRRSRDSNSNNDRYGRSIDYVDQIEGAVKNGIDCDESNEIISEAQAETSHVLSATEETGNKLEFGFAEETSIESRSDGEIGSSHRQPAQS